MILNKDIDKTIGNLMELIDAEVDANIMAIDMHQHGINREREILNIPIGIKMLNEFANDIAKRVKHLKHKPKYLVISDYGCGVGNVLTQLKMLLTAKLPFITQTGLVGCDKNFKFLNYAQTLIKPGGICLRSVLMLTDLSLNGSLSRFNEVEHTVMGTWNPQDILKIKFCNKMFSDIDEQANLEKNIIDNSLPGTYIIRPMKSSYTPKNAVVKTNRIVMRK